MPLSEDEERILTEIERHLYASDPALARQVAATANAPVPARRTQLAALGAAVALVATIALLSVNPLAAFVLGFLPMLACGWQLERALRRFGRHSAEQVAATFRNATAGERRLRMVDDDGPDDRVD